MHVFTQVFLTMVKLNELKYELFEHPPYSPDLLPPTITSSETWNNSFVESVFRRMRKLLQPWNSILQRFDPEGVNV